MTHPRKPPYPLWLWSELLLLFGAAPLLFTTGLISMRWLMPSLLLAAALSLVYLLVSPAFRRVRLWHFRGLRRELMRITAIFAVGAATMAAFMAVLVTLRELGWIHLHENVRWFALPRQRPGLWAMIMLGYPIISVYPQEIIYRAFLFHRYRPILVSKTARIFASAIAFAWVHIIFRNEVPVLLTLIGGLLFAWTYARSRSMAAVWLEHALYGCLVFTLGLGWLFYGGSVRAMEAVTP